MRFKNILFISIFGTILTILLTISGAQAVNPIATDSRIRTFVYGENEVFNVLTKYGYQSSVEFAKGEKISTLSIGDPVAFKVTPSDNRLFVKTMQNDRSTNMTVITNMRTYHFELSSKMGEGQDPVYVMRFYYPEEDFDKNAVGSVDDISLQELNIPAAAPSTALDDNLNYNYSMTGADTIAPLKVFDDGRSTFFKFANNNAKAPGVFLVSPTGAEIPVVFRDSGEYLAVDVVSGRLSLRLGNDVVCIFNESLSQ